MKHANSSMTKEHTVEPSKPKTIIEEFCSKPKHSGRILNHYCELCQEVLCTKCYLRWHQDHLVQPLSANIRCKVQELKELVRGKKKAFEDLDGERERLENMAGFLKVSKSYDLLWAEVHAFAKSVFQKIIEDGKGKINDTGLFKVLTDVESYNKSKHDAQVPILHAEKQLAAAVTDPVDYRRSLKTLEEKIKNIYVPELNGLGKYASMLENGANGNFRFIPDVFVPQGRIQGTYAKLPKEFLPKKVDEMKARHRIAYATAIHGTYVAVGQYSKNIVDIYDMSSNLKRSIKCQGHAIQGMATTRDE